MKEIPINDRALMVVTDNAISFHYKTLTEKEFARRMHRIFEQLNMAWNSRKDKTFVIKFHAFQRRRYFSPMFMPDIFAK